MSKTLQQLAKEALEVQDACNLAAVASGFNNMLHDLMKHCNTTDERNTHPITKVWLNKMVSLAGEDSFEDWNKVSNLSQGK